MSVRGSTQAGRRRRTTDTVVEVEGLRVAYGSKEAVRSLDLSVSRGEIVAVLGPNGAGKTTTLEVLEGYLRATAGRVSVLGEDPGRAGAAWRARVGVVLQSCAPEPELTAAETLALYAGFYPAPLPVEEVLEMVGLSSAADVRAAALSGGQLRRLDVGLALVGDPELVFLDEPTTGFDPAARRAAWQVIAGLRGLGKTVLLTTHYLEEAEALSDRIVVVSDGRVLAEGAPATLGGRHRLPSLIRLELARPGDWARVAALVGAPAQVAGAVATISSIDPVADLRRLTGALADLGTEVVSLTVARPSLEDVYLSLLEGDTK